MLRTRPAYGPELWALADVGGQALDFADFDVALLAAIACKLPISRNV